MAVKYRATYINCVDDTYKVDISLDGYVGSVIELTGKAILGLTSMDDLSYPIRSKYLKLSLLASADVDLDDLMNAEEREFSVSLYKGTELKFFGYLTSEGANKDWISKDTWIDFDVLDPIAFLEDLAHVDDLGAAYDGEEQLAKIIAQCLIRGFEDSTDAFEIKDYTFYDYNALNDSNVAVPYTTGRFLKDVTIDQGQWVDDESGESVSCQKVLLEVLGSLQLCISQIGGVWVIRHYLYDIEDVTSGYTNDYDEDGNDTTEITVSLPGTVEIKVDSTGRLSSDIVHVNEDQNYQYVRGLQKLATTYEYRYKKQLLKNGSFEGGVNGVSMPNWSSDGDYSESRDNGLIRILSYDAGVNTNNWAAESSSSIKVTADQLLKISGRFQSNFDDCTFNFDFRYTVSGTDYFIRFTSEGVPYWSDLGSLGFLIINAEDGVDVEFEQELPETFANGTIEVIINACSAPGGNTYPTDYVELYELTLTGSNASITGLTGVTDMQFLKPLKSDSDDIYLGTVNGGVLSNQLKKFSLGYPIVQVKDKHLNELSYFSLLYVYNENKISSSSRRKIFTGSFFGYLDTESILTIPQISDNGFVIVEYEFDTSENVGRYKLEERINADPSTLYNEVKIYAETVEPKIV